MSIIKRIRNVVAGAITRGKSSPVTATMNAAPGKSYKTPVSTLPGVGKTPASPVPTAPSYLKRTSAGGTTSTASSYKYSGGGSTGTMQTQAKIAKTAMNVGSAITNTAGYFKNAAIAAGKAYMKPAEQEMASGKMTLTAIAPGMPGAKEAIKGIAPKILNKDMGANLIKQLGPTTDTATYNAIMKFAADQAKRNAATISKNSYSLVTKNINIMKEGGRAVTVNTKKLGLGVSLLSKAVSPKTLKILGGAAASMFFGWWGQAESGEPIGIVMNKIHAEAEKTGDWTLYNEADAALGEITSLDVWEKVAMWTPLSPAIGIPNKIKGILKARELRNSLAANQQAAQESGVSLEIIERQAEIDDWEQYKIRNHEREMEILDMRNYYHRLSILRRERFNERDRLANLEAQEESIRLWEEYKERMIEIERKEREELAAFWLNYQLMKEKIEEDNSKSKLGFGIV
jgi:hypothetical protein